MLKHDRVYNHLVGALSEEYELDGIMINNEVIFVADSVLPQPELAYIAILQALVRYVDET